MTKTEMSQLEVAIGLIHDLRSEMHQGFSELASGQVELSERATAIETRAEEAAKMAERSLKLRMWGFGLAVSATVSVVLWAAKDFIVSRG